MPMKTAVYCPLCQAKNISNKLTLHQINMTTAVYLCEDKNCAYPQGYDWIEVKRSLGELLFEKQQSTGDTDLDNWLEEAFERETRSFSENVTNEQDSNNFLAEIFRELDSNMSGLANKKSERVNINNKPSSHVVSTQSTDYSPSCDYLGSEFWH